MNSITTHPAKQHMAILGGGCAGLSLAARVADWPDMAMTVIDHPDHKPRQDHNWGCWSINGLEDALAMARKTEQSGELLQPTPLLAPVDLGLPVLGSPNWVATLPNRAVTAQTRLPEPEAGLHTILQPPQPD